MVDMFYKVLDVSICFYILRSTKHGPISSGTVSALSSFLLEKEAAYFLKINATVRGKKDEAKCISEGIRRASRN